MILKKAKLQSRKTPNAKGQKGNHLVYQITIPKEIINETGWKKGEKINILANGERVVFEGDSFNNPDETKEESHKKKDSNTVAWKVSDRGLRSINRKLENLGTATSINFILLVIILLYLIFFGGMLL